MPTEQSIGSDVRAVLDAFGRHSNTIDLDGANLDEAAVDAAVRGGFVIVNDWDIAFSDGRDLVLTRKGKQQLNRKSFYDLLSPILTKAAGLFHFNHLALKK